jgi:glycerol uptake facilitator-like aquaporin
MFAYMHSKFIAESVGTFALALVVASSVAGVPAIPTPIAAGLTLGLFVYSIGKISGCHINPAVTVGLWSIKKISGSEAVRYVLAQLVGAVAAVLAMSVLFDMGGLSFALAAESGTVFLAEVLGTALFTFGIASVVAGRVHDAMSGVVVGGSLLFGIIVAVQLGSAGILNPAVALALGSLSLSYVGGAIVGAVLGMQLYRRLS